MPNALAVFVYFPNAVKGYAMNPALSVFEPERLRVVSWGNPVRETGRR